MTSPRPLPVCSTLWMGGALGPVERACLRSFVRQGHPVRLYHYHPVDGVPDGVELRDGREVLPWEVVSLHASSQAALGSDLFRYKLMSLEPGGYWVDADVYCLRPFDFPESYVFGWEAPDVLGTAVLRIAADSPVLTALIELFEGRTCPPWATPSDRRAILRRLQAGQRVDLAALSWGVAGPQAVSWLIARHRLTCFAAPTEVFYPLYWPQADWIADPARPLEAVAGPRTAAVHLWNNEIRRFKDAPAPAGSFLARLQAEGA